MTKINNYSSDIGRVLKLLTQNSNIEPEELEPQLISKACKYCKKGSLSTSTSFPEDPERIHYQILKYTEHVQTRGSQATTVAEIIADFVKFVNRPLDLAEQEICDLELRIFESIRNHEALKIRNSNFETPRDRQESIESLENLLNSIFQMSENVFSMGREIVKLEIELMDPEGRIQKMFDHLNDMNNFLTKLSLGTQRTIRLVDDEKERNESLTGLHLTLTNQLRTLYPDSFRSDLAAQPLDSVDTVPEQSVQNLSPQEITPIAGAMALTGKRAILPMAFSLFTTPVFK